ncbi:MAG: hypothetical protein H7061_06150, partial [Bdellovibrionaceae bacterium]|nr:hypothetical protein [Bdellovibrio sp.]
SHPPHGFFGLSQDWLIGITLQAVTLSIMFGVFVFLIKTSGAHVLQAKKQKVAARSYQGIGVSFMRLVLRVAGLRAAYLFLWFIVPYYYLFSARACRSSAQYWKVVKPEMNFISRQKSILRQLFVFAQVLVDRAYQRGEKDLKFKIVEGAGIPEFKQTLKNSPQGLVAMQCHLGGWEISMSYFTQRYLESNKKMVAVMFGQGGAHEHSSLQKSRPNFEVAQFNQQKDTIMKLRSYLEKGDLVGLMADRPVGRSYELIPFCGKLGLFDSTGIRLANLCKANVFFIFSVRLGYKEYYVNNIRAHLDTLIDQSLSNEDKVVAALKIYAELLESYLKKHPEQWFNFFPFWSETLF